MRRSLTWKLLLAFLAVSLAGAALAAVFSRYATLRAFDRLVDEQTLNTFVVDATTYYEINGDWNGVADFLRRRSQRFPTFPGQIGPQQAMQPFRHVLADQDGVVIVAASGYQVGQQLSENVLEEGIPIEIDGQTVGTVVPSEVTATLNPFEQQYLERINRALLLAGVGATLFALLLGIYLARALTHPLRDLTNAIRAMADGNLAQKVAVPSQDELGELADAFNQMSVDLAHANQLRQQMTADIAHDLRTPLTVITGYVEALRDGVLEATPERFEAIENETHHLQRLIEDLRTLSLADAGQLSLNLQSVSPRALLERLVAAYTIQADRQGVALHLEASSPETPDIHVDPDRVMQVLENLITNALRHTHKGGEIVVSTAQGDGHVTLAIRDNGEGIPPEALTRIFDRFYRVDESRHQPNDESGLGLAIAKSLVEAHGGHISVESTIGSGTIFQIEFPLPE